MNTSWSSFRISPTILPKSHMLLQRNPVVCCCPKSGAAWILKEYWCQADFPLSLIAVLAQQLRLLRHAKPPRQSKSRSRTQFSLLFYFILFYFNADLPFSVLGNDGTGVGLSVIGRNIVPKVLCGFLTYCTVRSKVPRRLSPRKHLHPWRSRDIFRMNSHKGIHGTRGTHGP